MTSPQAGRGQTKQRPGKGRPLPQGGSLYTPGASDPRRRIEQASARPLVLLHQMPVWLPPILVAALLIVGLAVPGPVGAIALLLVAAFLGWLAALSWPQTKGNGRLLRAGAITCVLVVAIIQATR